MLERIFKSHPVKPLFAKFEKISVIMNNFLFLGGSVFYSLLPSFQCSSGVADTGAGHNSLGVATHSAKDYHMNCLLPIIYLTLILEKCFSWISLVSWLKIQRGYPSIFEGQF